MKRNKLIGIMVVVCVMALCATLFTGCKGSSLTTPEGFQCNDGTFSWEAVEGADGYMVFVNDALNEFYTTETSVSINHANIKGTLIDNQTNTLWVKAVTVDEDGKVKSQSESAKFEFDYVSSAGAEWKVTFNLNYTGAPEAQEIPVKNGEKFSKPTDPQRAGWTFDGWFRDEDCLMAAEFDTNGKSTFDVTANLPLYAKWSPDSSVTTTKVYVYLAEGNQVSVKPSKGETALYTGDGIVMTAVAGKDKWYQADIDDTATSVIFVSGAEASESLSFDKAKPYYKDGAWTATMPEEPGPQPQQGVYIKVGSAAPVQLAANPAVEGEYMIDLILNVDDTVVITIDGVAVSNYDSGCGFNGTVTKEGKHSFYVSAEKIWVTVPQDLVVDSAVKVIINDDESKAVGLQKNEKPDNANVIQEYFGTVTLKAGDTIKIMEDDFEYKNYEPGCKFSGTATVDGDYTFYAKKYLDGGDSVWVEVPAGFVVPTPNTIKVYYYNNGWDDNWSAPTAYCWNTKGNNGWPGATMTALGDGWFVAEIETGYENILFKGLGTNQTADFTLVVAGGVAYYNYDGVTELRPAA